MGQLGRREGRNGGGFCKAWLLPGWVCVCGGHLLTFLLFVTHAATGVVPPVRIESSFTSPSEGHTLDLKCIVATSMPQAKVTWYKRGAALPAGHQVWHCSCGTRPEGLRGGGGRDQRPEAASQLHSPPSGLSPDLRLRPAHPPGFTSRLWGVRLPREPWPGRSRGLAGSDHQGRNGLLL